jgi:ankyrin repeat protein
MKVLMAVLQLERIWVERTATKISKALGSLPSKLEETYHDTLTRIKNQAEPDNVLGMRVLQWISRSKRPLLVDELREVLAVEWDDDEEPPRKLDLNNLLDPESMVDVCAGLVIIENESKVICLVHFTTEEFFRRSGGSFFPDAEAQISKTCLAYLQFDAFGTGPCVSDEDLGTRLQLFPFLNYAARYWGYHLRGKPERDLEEMALNLLNNRAGLEASTQVLLVSERRYDGYSQGFPKNLTALHIAANFGSDALVLLLLEKGADVNAKDSEGQTPLSWAGQNGHEAVVRLLLGRGDVDPDSPDSYFGLTPLSWAAGSGHEAVVRLLLGRVDVEPDSRDSYSGQTPLSCAAGSGHEAVVRLLLGRVDVEPDSRDSYLGRTPLSWAAESGHEAVVRLLLGRGDVDPDSPDKEGRTPLSRAAGSGHEAVVRLLLGRGDVDPDSPDSYFGQTPLSWAARSGHEAVVRLLLGRVDVEPDSPDSYFGQTPLSWAAGKGHEAVVRLLLGRGDVDPDSPDKFGRTPLSRAAGSGHEAVVRLLLGRGDVEPDSPDKFGRTPLLRAAGSGHEAVVRLLTPLTLEV